MNSTPAFRYVGDKIVRCEHRGHMFREMAPETEEEREENRRDLFHPTPVDRRQARRRFARLGSLGRRSARRVPSPGPRALYMPARRIIVFVGHLFRRAVGHALFPGAPVPHVEVLLYLPEGEQPTERHVRELEREMR